MDYDAPSNRLAVGNRYGLLVLFTVENTIIPLASVTVEDYLPKSLTFGPTPPSGGVRDLLTFGMHDGTV